MQTRIFHLQALSALHVGTGQGVGVVDLPIARAKATNLPIVAGSALKGVLRDEAENQFNLADVKRDIKTLFGPMNNDEVSHAGALAFGDAQLLLLPIRSFAGTVAYATCPYILRQYQRDAGLNNFKIPTLDSKQAGVVEGSSLFVGRTQEIALEDLDIQADYNNVIEAWADQITEQLYPETVVQFEQWREAVKKRFVILPDNIFSFLADTATEVRTRIRIDRDTRIVKDGALWTEENLPAETVLWGVIGVSASRNKENKQSAEQLAALLPLNKELTLQIGGKHTVGRGLCRMLFNQVSQA